MVDFYKRFGKKKNTKKHVFGKRLFLYNFLFGLMCNKILMVRNLCVWGWNF